MKAKKIKLPTLSVEIRKYVSELDTLIWSNVIDIRHWHNECIYQLHHLVSNFNQLKADYVPENLFQLFDFVSDDDVPEQYAVPFTVHEFNIFNVKSDEDLEVIKSAILHEVNRRGYKNVVDFGKSAGCYFGKYKTLEELNLHSKITDWYGDEGQ